MQYFADHGHKCPQLYNPADYYLDVTSPDFRNADLEASSLQRVETLAAAWDKVQGANPASIAARERSPSEEAAASNTGYHSSWWRQFQLIFWRSCVNTWRDKGALIGKVVSS